MMPVRIFKNEGGSCQEINSPDIFFEDKENKDADRT